jgi:hypothetical protein
VQIDWLNGWSDYLNYQFIRGRGKNNSREIRVCSSGSRESGR